MKLADYRISLDILESQSQYSLPMKQGDNSRVIYITLREGGVPYEISADCFAVFSGKKPDGTILENNCVIKENTIIYAITEQTTAVSGLVDCEIKLYGVESALICSPRFSIIVDKRVVGEEKIESTSEFTALTELYSNVVTSENERVAAEELRDVAEDAREYAETERSAAEVIRTLSEDERNAAEAERKTAESTRAKEFEQIICEGTAGIDALNKATNNANNIVKDIQNKLDNGDFNEIKYISEQVAVQDLDYGYYCVDSNNGGEVNLTAFFLEGATMSSYIYSGVIFVIPNVLGGKLYYILGIEDNNYSQEIYSFMLDENNNLIEDYSANFVDKKYVDEKIKNINEIKVITKDTWIGDLENGIYLIDGTNGGILNGDFSNILSYTGAGSFLDGVVFVSDFFCDTSSKLITLIVTDDGEYFPRIYSVVIDEGGVVLDGYGDVFVTQRSLDNQIASLQLQIDKLKTLLGEASALIGGAE